MLEAPFTGAVSMYGFYAMQPYLLDLYGDERAYTIAGLSAALVAGAQIAGGLLVPHLRRLFRRRTSMLLAAAALSALMLAAIGLVQQFWVAVAALAVWALMFAATMPVRHAYLNGLIGSPERATVLSFDSLLSSAGGVAGQPALGRVADVAGYPASYLVGALVQAGSIPMLWLARRQRAASDAIAAT
jgi:MFS family permease